ncbi:phage portal protein [Streptococcus ferus]|uniref:phage portal protein n=1 Tax=Streptococcus ferus TaxID=1345 RepID=UPI003518FEC2
MPVFNFANMANDSPTQAPKSDGFYGLSESEIIENLTGAEWVSARAALRNSDLFAVINQLSSDLASVKLVPVRKQMRGIINNPSNNANRHGFYQAIYAQLLLGGEAFVYRWRNENGRDIKWEFIRPSNINYNPLDTAEGLYYNISFNDPHVAPKMRVPQSDVLHFRLLSVDGGLSGVSPLVALSRELEIQKANTRLTLNSLKNALNANGILRIKNGGLLDFNTKMSRSRQAVKQMTGGPLVLDDLEDFTPIEIKSNVANLLSQTDWTSKQFAKIYGIPDSYLGGQGDQQSSIEMISGMYANAVSRYVRPVLDELINKLNTDIDTDLFPAVDPLGATYIKRVNEMRKNDVIDSKQAVFMLKRSEIIPQDLPEVEPAQQESIERG